MKSGVIQGMFWLCVFCFLNYTSKAQPSKFIKYQIATLAGPGMDGRGYVERGHEKAARYIARKFAEWKLTPLQDSNYLMPFFMAVNTFPDTVLFKAGKKTYAAGKDYLVMAMSNEIRVKKMKMKNVDARKWTDSSQFFQWIKNERVAQYGYVVKGLDSFLKVSKLTKKQFYQTLPKGLFILPQSKLIWTVARDTVATTVLQMPDSLLTKKLKKASLIIENKFIPAQRTYNVTAFVPGTEYPDSFIVFTAHYDHLGKMGKATTFNGASDNASGTAAMLYLANYYVQHPQKYSIAFMAMGGEEAGLVGSKYYVEHPQFPLERIKFLTNLDIMGSAEDGISVVNGKVLPKQYGWLDSINKAKQYVPKVVQGDKASNSDHHYFYEAGVPAIFIFTRGGPGFYHDVYDIPKSLPLKNLDEVMYLIQDFVQRIQQ